MKIIYTTFILVAILLLIAITYLVLNNKSVPSSISPIDNESALSSTEISANMEKPSSCVAGLTSYQNTDYGFSMCIPEDAEVINQFETDGGEILDLVVVRRDDLPKLHEYEEFDENPYLAILKSKVSAFAIERIKRDEVIDENMLKSIMPTQIPCPDTSMSCAENETLNVKLLEWEKLRSENLTFRYRDEVSTGAKKKWNNVGFVWSDDKATYQMESIVPSNPITEQAMRAMAESFR